MSWTTHYNNNYCSVVLVQDGRSALWHASVVVVTKYYTEVWSSSGSASKMRLHDAQPDYCIVFFKFDII